MAADGRPNLSRDFIAQTALRMTDEVGLADLSMRKLGKELGVEAMSLYHYVSNKDGLLDAMLDQLYSEIELPRHIPDDDWEQATRGGLASFYEVLLRRRAALELFSTRPAKSAIALEVHYWSFRRFETVGLSAEQSVRAFRFAVSFVTGHAIAEIGMLSQRAAGEPPDLGGIADPAMLVFLEKSQEITDAEYFQSGIDAVVAGLRAMFDLP